MRIPQPLGFAWLARIWTKLGDWGDVEVYRRGKLEIRRLDILLLLLGCSIAVFYWVFYSWQAALVGTLLYLLVMMCALWLF